MAKKTINKTKRQLTKWEKIFANDTSDQGLISKIYKESVQLNTDNIPIQLKNGRGPKRTVLQGKHTDDNTHSKTIMSTTILTPHTCQNGYYQKDKKQQVLERMWRKESPYTLMVGM